MGIASIHEYLIFTSKELIVSSIYTYIGHTHPHNFFAGTCTFTLCKLQCNLNNSLVVRELSGKLIPDCFVWLFVWTLVIVDVYCILVHFCLAHAFLSFPGPLNLGLSWQYLQDLQLGEVQPRHSPHLVRL